MKKLILACVISALSSLACAADTQYSKTYDACINEATSNSDMRDCIGTEYRKQDARLGKVYNQLKEELNVERKQKLLVAQRLWIKYPDANSGFAIHSDSGTQDYITANMISLEMTKSRADELTGFLAETRE